jgi:hypothetical protein
MQKPRRQHYVPVSYLSRFKDNDHIFVTDLRERKYYSTSPQNVANIRDFYVIDTGNKSDDNIVESYFAKVEDKASPILDSFIKTMQMPNRNEWAAIAEFIGGIHVRVPEFRQKYLELSHHLYDVINHFQFSTEEAYKRTCEKYYRETGQKIDLPYEKIREVVDKPESYCIALHQNEYIHSMFNVLPTIVDIIFHMTPYLFIAVGNARFITSDNPVVLIDRNPNRPKYFGYGWLVKTVQAYFPISPFSCLAFSWEGEYTALPANDTCVAQINSYIAWFCTRHIFSNRQEIYWRQKNGGICSDYATFVNDFAPSKKNRKSSLIQSPIPQVSRDFDLNMIRKSFYSGNLGTP